MFRLFKKKEDIKKEFIKAERYDYSGNSEKLAQELIDYFNPKMEIVREKCAMIFDRQALSDYERLNLLKNRIEEIMKFANGYYNEKSDMEDFLRIFKRYFIKKEEMEIIGKIEYFEKKLRDTKFIL